jgi:diguanylate cyclase (GGDEF)-like protein
VLGDVLDLDEGRLNGAVADALRARLIERTADLRFAFVHDCIREAMLDRLRPADLRLLHQALAESIEALDDRRPETVLALARHYSLGEAGTPEKVYRWNEAAGRVALAAFAATDARQFFTDAALAAGEAAIAVDAPFEETFGVIMLRAGDAEAAHDHFQAALALTSEPWARAGIYVQLSRAELGLWNAAVSWEYVEAGLRAIGCGLPRNPVTLWLGAAQQGLIGLSCIVSGRGFGEVAGEEREKVRALVELYEAGAGASYYCARPISMAGLCLRALPLVARLGESREFSRVYNNLAVLAGSVGLGPVVDRLADRSLAVAETIGDPQLIALAQIHRAYGHELAGDTVRAATLADEALAHHGRWLDIQDLLTAVSSHPLSRELRGLTAEAHDVWMSAYDRTRHSNRPGASGNPYLFVGITIYAAAGRIAEAAHQLRLANDVMTDADSGPVRKALLTERKLRYMLEMDELEDYDRLAGEADRLHFNPLTTTFYLKGTFTWTAHAAIERLRRATSQERPARLTEARKRVRRERWYATEPIFRAHHIAHRAALAQIEHDDRLAMKLAAKAEVLAIKTEAPSIHFEVACIRARVAMDRGHRAEGARQARVAAQLARDHGWLRRRRLLQSEFGELGDFDSAAGRPHTAAASIVPSTGVIPSAASDHPHDKRTRRDRSLDTLLALSMASSQVHDPDELAWVALDQLVAQLGAERAFLFLADDDGQVDKPRAARNADGESLVDVHDYASTVVERVRVERTALVVTGTEEGAAIGSESSVQHGLRSILAAPLMLEGRFLGVVYLDSRLAKGVFTAEDVEILAAISNHIAVSIETARATRLELVVTSEREQRSLAETLRDSMTVVSATLEPVGVLERTLQTTARVITYDRAVALLVRDGTWTLTAVAGDLRFDGPVDLPDDPHLTGLTADGTGMIGSYDAPLPHLLGQPGSWLSVPLVARGELIGALLIAADEERALGPAQLELAATFAAQGIVAYENAKLFEAVERLATTDELTSLNNRRQFFNLGEAAFVQARRYRRPLAAIMIDIDHFKRVNDNYGHAVGDDVIRIVAARLKDTIREIDIVGRYGGEEFAMILPETDEDVKVVGERLCQAVSSERIMTDAGPLQVHISMGVATLTDRDISLAAVLSRADAALFRAKAQGRNCVVLAG